MKIFVIKNQSDLFCSKQEEWVSQIRAKEISTYKHHDEALNHLLELNIKDIALRGRIIGATKNESGQLIINTLPAS